MLTSTMSDAEERRYAAAYRCVACGLRTLVTWDEVETHAREARGHRPIEEK